LGSLSLHINQLSGNISADLGNLSKLYVLNISQNYFTCADMPDNFIQFAEKFSFYYTPQYYTPENYEDIKTNIFDTLSIDQSLNLAIDFPFETTNLSYQWYKNGEILEGATQATLNIDNIQPTDAGKYTLRIKTKNCFPDSNTYTLLLPNIGLIPQLPDGTTFEQVLSEGRSFEAPSDPIYLVFKGFDLFGQPVEYDQIMVQFDNKEDTEKYENEILYNPEHLGEVAESCNCNREIHLWEFPSTKNAAKALIEIDKKTKRGKKKSALKGGFNNQLNVGDKYNISEAVTVKNDSLDKIYPDSAVVFLLDSGLDYQDFDATPFLMKEAPVDNCYSIESAPGYSYTDTTNINTQDTIIPLSNNYQDDHWHGTFGFRTITENLTENHKIKIVPLKIFNNEGEGNLFDMTCALYHAIDHNADIINISAGYSGQPSDILENAILLAKEKEIFITTATGNDSVDIDSLPQYPAWYANQYNSIEYIDGTRNIEINTLKYDHVISVVSLDASNKISQFSNFGEQSATLAAYGERIHSYGLEGLDVVASGTSMATYAVTKELALEIASDRNRTQKQIWNNFKKNRLLDNESIEDFTSTGKQLNVRLEEPVIYGCKDPSSCNYFEYVTDEDGSCEYNSCNCVYADWAALKALYENTDGENWKRNHNWDILQSSSIPADCNFDNLYGIQLNENGRVAKINLYNNNLSGNIPKELKGLSELNSLYLAANNLVGQIPPELSKLTHLENLILSVNNLSGPIPIQFVLLSKLKSLFLSYNNLSGEIPRQLYKLSELEYLLLNNNELTGVLPAELISLSNLYQLNISNNQLSGCYEDDLTLFCDQSSHFKDNANISDGNNFDAEWRNFCLNAEGACINNKNSNIETSEFKVYPNPSSGKFVLEILSTNNKIEIFNILNLEGKILLQIHGNALRTNLFELDLNEMSKGVYFIEMKTDENSYIQKLILE